MSNTKSFLEDIYEHLDTGYEDKDIMTIFHISKEDLDYIKANREKGEDSGIN